MSLDPRLADAFQKAHGFDLRAHLVVLGTVGSHSHGTYLPPTEPNAVDDLDLMGFVVPPVEYHLGLPRWEHWVWKFEELDVVLYSLHKAFTLLLKGNPNIVGLLWLREDGYDFATPTFAKLREARDIFSSQQVAHSFAGYAYGQLKRMEAFSQDRMDTYARLRAEVEVYGPIGELVEGSADQMTQRAKQWKLDVVTAQRFRKLHKEHFSGYMGEKRKALVQKYSYDVKNAAHLIRLLRMGAEFVQTGNLQVYRTTDADELKAIKRGAWTLEQVKAEAERLFAGLDEAVAASNLPPHPDTGAANDLLLQLHREVLAL